MCNRPRRDNAGEIVDLLGVNDSVESVDGQPGCEEPIASLSVEQGDELVDADLTTTQDAAQRSSVEFRVERHGDRGTSGTCQPDMTPLLTNRLVPELGEGGDTRRAGDHRQRTHVQPTRRR